MITVTEHSRRYWRYEYDAAANYMAPLLESWGVDLRNAAVIDVGCGEGGGTCGLHDRGARCVGFDIDADRIAVGQALKDDRAVEFVTGDIYTGARPFADRRFDLVVLHDVFEHLEQKALMIEHLKSYLAPDGRILITFPPYFSAYGAHQQHLTTSFARIPFFHLIPFSMSFVLPRLRHEHPPIVREVQKLGRLKMGMRGFERIARNGGLRVAKKQAYIISPNHIRFGLRPVGAGVIGGIPLVGELLCTGVVYLLAKA